MISYSPLRVHPYHVCPIHVFPEQQTETGKKCEALLSLVLVPYIEVNSDPAGDSFLALMNVDDDVTIMDLLVAVLVAAAERKMRLPGLMQALATEFCCMLWRQPP